MSAAKASSAASERPPGLSTCTAAAPTRAHDARTASSQPWCGASGFRSQSAAGKARAQTFPACHHSSRSAPGEPRMSHATGRSERSWPSRAIIWSATPPPRVAGPAPITFSTGGAGQTGGGPVTAVARRRTSSRRSRARSRTADWPSARSVRSQARRSLRLMRRGLRHAGRRDPTLALTVAGLPRRHDRSGGRINRPRRDRSL